MDPTYDERRARLRADCSRCAALCCVVPAFSRSSDFAIDKPAGRPCPNLRSDLRCGIHEHLRDREDVETHSEGDEPDRHLVVTPS